MNSRGGADKILRVVGTHRGSRSRLAGIARKSDKTTQQ